MWCRWQNRRKGCIQRDLDKRGRGRVSGAEWTERCCIAAGLELWLLHKNSFLIAHETAWFTAVISRGVLAGSSHVLWNVLPLAMRHTFGAICRGWFISLQNTINSVIMIIHITVRPEGLSQDQSWKLLQQKAVPVISEDVALVSVSLLCL